MQYFTRCLRQYLTGINNKFNSFVFSYKCCPSPRVKVNADMTKGRIISLNTLFLLTFTHVLWQHLSENTAKARQMLSSVCIKVNMIYNLLIKKIYPNHWAVSFKCFAKGGRFIRFTKQIFHLVALSNTKYKIFHIIKLIGTLDKQLYIIIDKIIFKYFLKTK